MEKFRTIVQLCTLASLLFSIVEAQSLGNGSTGTEPEKAPFQIIGDDPGCRENCKRVSPDELFLRSEDSLVKKKDDDILSLDNFNPKGREREVMRDRKERRRRKRKRRKKSQRIGGQHAGGRKRRRRKKHLREEEVSERGELKKRERMRRRRRLYEEQKEFQR